MAVRFTAIILVVILLAALAGQALCAEAPRWPLKVDTALGINSRSDARFQLMGEVYGPFQRDLTLRVGGWLVYGGSDGTKGFLSNAYVGLDRPQFYLAAGQKFVVFGPAGLMVSPGARGAEAVVKGRPLTLQLLGGRTQFTPPAGNAGRTTPNSDPLFGQDRERRDFFAARVEYDLLKRERHSYIGLNSLWASSRSGASIDLDASAGPNKRFYAEVSSFDGSVAMLGGMRFTDLRETFHTARDTSLDIFWRKVPDDYFPAVIGASQYYADRSGLALTLQHKVSDLSAFGLYGDGRGVQVNFFRFFDLGGR